MLSRLKYKQFWLRARSEGKKFENKPTPIPEELNMEDIWLSEVKLDSKKERRNKKQRKLSRLRNKIKPHTTLKKNKIL